MQLIVAEKPSVARDLSRVLAVRPAGRNYFEGARCVITWCVGHLVELEEPAAYDARWKAWRLDSLPMLPSEFQLRPSKHAIEQLRVVARLLRDRRFTSVVNACDAGREGELIFRYLYQYAASSLPVQRLWISSLTDDAIRRGFTALRPAAQLDALGDAARSRSEADWLVGMNATRGITVRGRETGHDALYSIGRVQTPTLAMLVERERAIAQFVPRDYWEVRGEFTTASGERFSATWRRVDARDLAGGQIRAPGDSARDPSGASMSEAKRWGVGTLPAPQVGRGATAPVGSIERTLDTTRLGSLDLARAIVARDAEHGAAASPLGPRVERMRARTVREPPPLLFDLTSLQRTVNRRFGWSASRTLEVAQALYERRKVVTYPRTDSRHLTSDVARDLARVFTVLAEVPDYAAFAGELIARPPRPSRRIVDDAKVHDHHAIIPTGKPIDLAALDRDERRLFDLIVRRFLGAFFPDAEFAATEAWIRVLAPDGPPPPFPGDARGTSAERGHFSADTSRSQRGDGTAASGQGEHAGSEAAVLDALPPPPDRYLARGRVRVVAGWQAVAGIAAAGRPGADATDSEQAALPPLVEGQPLDGQFAFAAKQTRPPPRYTEATLLSAMESAGKVIDDEALREAMKDRGLGTPATRAAIIETLLRRAYIVRDKQQLVPTPMGIGLIAALPVASLASPELTGSWEARLTRIARGIETRTAFMADITRYVAELVDAIRGASPPPPPPPGSAPAQARPRGRFGRGSKRRSASSGGTARRPRGGRQGQRPGETPIAPVQRGIEGPAASGTRSTSARAASVGRDAVRPPRARRSKATQTPAPVFPVDEPAARTTRESARATPIGRDHGPSAAARCSSQAPPARVPRSIDEAARAGRSSRPPVAATAPPVVEELTCPRCRAGALMTGARGWGCSRWREGCRFVVWFETAGRKLTLAQLRDLVVRGRTRKARFGDQTGSLVLDDGEPRFVAAQPVRRA